MNKIKGRSEIIHFEGMTHAPENELGVVFLFGKVHKRLGFTGVSEVKPGFPDCWAWRRTSKQLVWIEFEFKSSGFKIHVNKKQHIGLKPKRGFVVCWEHNWPDCEQYADVIDLRAIVEEGPRVWIQSALPKYHWEMDRIPFNAGRNRNWTVSPSAKKGDILLLWRAGSKTAANKVDEPHDRLQSFANVVQVVSAPQKREGGFIRSAEIKRIANLENPLHWGALRSDAVLRSSPFVRAQMQGQWDVTPYWWRLHSLLTQLNPKLKNNPRFKKFDPHRLW